MSKVRGRSDFQYGQKKKFSKGVVMSKIKIIVADTFGTDLLTDRVKNYFPKTTFIGHNIGGSHENKAHPHGFQVASRMLLPLIDDDVEVHFIRYLDSHGEDPNRELFKLVKEIKPDLWQNSWGQPRVKGVTDNVIAQAWKDWVVEEQELRTELKYILSFAGGNTDTFGLSFHDVGYPTRLINNVVVSGAIDRTGHVTDFSSDGNITCCALGHYVMVLNPYTAKWEIGSGTSFASPDTAGLILWLKKHQGVDTYDKFIEWLHMNATTPEGFPSDQLPHPKFGWGGVSDAYMEVTKNADAYVKAGVPPVGPNPRMMWFDFTRVG